MIFNYYVVSSEGGFAKKPTLEAKLIPSTKCLLINGVDKKV
jgi:hypothetical protein